MCIRTISPIVASTEVRGAKVVPRPAVALDSPTIDSTPLCVYVPEAMFQCPLEVSLSVPLLFVSENAPPLLRIWNCAVPAFSIVPVFTTLPVPVVVSRKFKAPASARNVPLLFSTLVVGIAGHGDDMKKVGRLAWRSILYFEVVTTAALAIGLIAVNLVKPGVGITLATATADKGAEFAKTQVTFSGVVEHMVPQSFFEAATHNEVLQIVFFAVLFGFAAVTVGGNVKPLTDVLEKTLDVMFRMVAMIMKLAPLGAFGALITLLLILTAMFADSIAQYDPLELELPDIGLVVMQDAETGEQLLVDTRDRGFRRRFADAAAKREDELRSAFDSRFVTSRSICVRSPRM